MKKIFTGIFALLGLTLAVSAGPVSRTKALDVAYKFMAPEKPMTKAGEEDLKVIYENDAFYIVTHPDGGFVIVAADDKVRPVLGFSFENNFVVEDMPDNVKWWLEHIARECRTIMKGTPTKREKAYVQAGWDAFMDTKVGGLPSSQVTDKHEEFFTVNWNQTDPANLLCPTVSGQGSRSICGCLPLALSEVMVHHGYPAKGTGTLPSYSYTSGNNKNVKIEGYELTTEYDWDGMRELKKPTQFYNAKDPVKTNLAHLVYDVGVMVQADFNSSSYGGTGAYSNQIPRLMAKYMGYSTDAKIIYMGEGAYTTREKWINAIKDEAQKRAFLFCGYSVGSWGNDAGHAYVVDGYGTYNDETVFHFNMGWGGDCNGYYHAYSQDVDSQYTFDDYLEALINLYPAEHYDYNTGTLGFENAGGISLGSGDRTPAKGESVSVTVKNIANVGAKSFNGKAWVQHVSRGGEVLQEELLKNFSSSPLASGNSISSIKIDFTFANAPGFGDCMRVVFVRDGETEVIPVVYTQNGSIIAEWPLMPAAFIVVEDSYKVNDKFQFLLKNCNYSYTDAQWAITSPNGSVNTNQQSAGFQDLIYSGRYKVEVTTSKEKLTAYINVK